MYTTLLCDVSVHVYMPYQLRAIGEFLRLSLCVQHCLMRLVISRAANTELAELKSSGKS